MPDVAQDEIRDLEKRIEQADIVADPELLDALIDDAFYFTGPDGTIIHKSAVLEAHRPAGARKFVRYATSDLRIADYGPTVVVTVRIDLATKAVEQALRFTRIWLKQDSGWKVIGGSAVRIGSLKHLH